MNAILSTLGLSDAAKAQRQFCVGGSDANTIMSGNADRILALWREKRGERAPDDLSDNLAVQMGSFTEPLNAEDALNSAHTLDELATIWRRKAMAPFRAQLQSVLDERKAALQSTTGEGSAGAAGSSPQSAEPVAADEPGRADSDMGEAFTADELIDRIERIQGDPALVESFLDLHADDLDAYDDADKRRVRGAANARAIELKRKP